MAVNYRTQSLVLAKNDLREADQVFIVFSKDFGKIKLLGKAIRKINSKLRSGIGLFYLSEIEFIQGKNYKTITDAIVLEKFKNFREDLDKLEIAQKIAEATDKLIKGEEPDERIWNLLVDVFGKLSFYDRSPVGREIIYYYFFWNLVSLLGYQTDLYHCAKCQEKLIPEILNFSSGLNGIICLRCSDDSIKDKLKIFPEAVKILRIIQENNWEKLEKIKIEKEHLEELEKISQSYLEGLTV